MTYNFHMCYNKVSTSGQRCLISGRSWIYWRIWYFYLYICL